MTPREIQSKLPFVVGQFSRSTTEMWTVRLRAVFPFLLGCFLIGRIYRDSFQDMLVVLVIGLFGLSYVEFRRISVCYSIRDGVICFERPRGKVRWQELVSDISQISGTPGWFRSEWVVLRFGARRRYVELLPSLEQALHQAVPPDTSQLER